MAKRRAWRTLLLLSLGGVCVQLTGCLSAIQREIEVVFAPEVLENALFIPYSVVYNLFGPLLR
jgi:hypothetical protein